MAIVPSALYSGQVETGDAGYPQGKARNAGAFQDGTGTPLERAWLNDLWGFLQALLDVARLTPSGVPDAVGASQYLDAVRSIAGSRSLVLRALDLNGAAPGTNQFIGAATLENRVYLGKGGANGMFRVVETDLASLSATVTLTEIRKMVTISPFGSPSRVAAIGGTGSVHIAYSDNGTLWTTRATGLPVPPTDGVWSGARLIVSTAAGNASRSPDGHNWSLSTVGSDIADALDTPDGGLAALSNGDVIAAGGMGDGRRAFAVSTDDGLTWSYAGDIPASADYTVRGSVAGDGGDEVYWLGKPLANRLDLWVSSDGTTWTKRAEVAGFNAPTAQPKLFCCPDTGTLVAAIVSGVDVRVSASIDRGRTWSGIVTYNLSNLGSLAVARGRVFATIGSRMFASDALA